MSLDRREVMILGGAVALGAAAGGAAVAAPRPLLIADAALDPEAARRAARAAGAELAAMGAGEDPVRFWARIAPRLADGAPVLGLTGWADYLVLRGMAESGRLRARLEAPPGEDLASGGAAPVLAGPLQAALTALGGARGRRMAWAMV